MRNFSEIENTLENSPMYLFCLNYLRLLLYVTTTDTKYVQYIY